MVLLLSLACPSQVRVPPFPPTFLELLLTSHFPFLFFLSPDSNPRFAAFLKALKASEHNAKLEAVFAETEARDGGIDSMDTS